MKKLKVTGLALALVTILGLSTLFISTTEINANTDWTVPIINDANKELGSVGFNKKEELKSRQISNEMKNALDPVIEEQQAELERLLEEYYQMKLQGLMDTQQFADLEKQIVTIRTSIYNRYVKEIDSLFQ